MPKPLKLANLFICFGSNISSSENDVSIHKGKVWIVIDRLSTTWKYDLSDKIRQELFHAVAVSVLLYCCTTSTLMKNLKRVRRELHNDACCFEDIQHTTKLMYGHLSPISQSSKWDEQDTVDIAREVRINL